MKYLLLSIIVLLSFESCRVVKKDPLSKTKSSPSNNINYIYLDDIKNGEHLERASSTTDKKYFDYIMSNEVSKNSMRPIYETVLETSDRVYYGIVKYAPGSNKQIVDPFYSAPIENIKIYFPGFQDIDGANVRAKVFYLFFDREIEMKLKPICPNSYSYNYNDYKINLTDMGIRVDATLQGKCYEDIQFGKSVSVILDPTNLDLLQAYTELYDNNTGKKTEEGSIGDTENVLKKGVIGKVKSLY